VRVPGNDSSIDSRCFSHCCAPALCSMRRFPWCTRADSEVVAPNADRRFRVSSIDRTVQDVMARTVKEEPPLLWLSPVFLAIADDTVIRRIAANGEPGTSMPAFAQSAGGMLTNSRLMPLCAEFRSWAKPDVLGDQTPPSYLRRGSWRSSTWRRCLSNLLRLLSRSQRTRREQGQLDCRRIISCPGKRPVNFEPS
jgi:hypothetical protein